MAEPGPGVPLPMDGNAQEKIGNGTILETAETPPDGCTITDIEMNGYRQIWWKKDKNGNAKHPYWNFRTGRAEHRKARYGGKWNDSRLTAERKQAYEEKCNAEHKARLQGIPR